MNPHDLTAYRRIILLTDGYSTPFLAKTAISLLRYRREDIAGVLDQTHAGKSSADIFPGAPDVPIVDSLHGLNADALFVGIAPPGGALPPEWRATILEAIDGGLDIVSGLHDFLIRDAEFVTAANKSNVRLIDVRRNDECETAKVIEFRPECLRIHAIGNDCSLGKMVTALEVQRGLVARGMDAGFAATGQTGIMVSGTGIPIDCVVADFVNGAAERLVLAHQDHDYLLIEGQGSIAHPAYSGVTVGLLHGCAPHGLIFCYESGREMVKGFDHRKIPPIKDIFQVGEALANLRHPCKIIGVAANTRNLDEAAAKTDMQRTEDELGVPVCDVYRFGSARLVDAAIELRAQVLSE